jgi:hypothetical protein
MISKLLSGRLAKTWLKLTSTEEVAIEEERDSK